jgi:hypothetical protein
VNLICRPRLKRRPGSLTVSSLQHSRPFVGMARAISPILLLLLLSSVSGDNGILDLLNGLIASQLPAINSAVVSAVPQSYGNCGSNSPPQPCVGTTDLYYVHKSWEYKAIARWISGLKSIVITSANFTKTVRNITTPSRIL